MENEEQLRLSGLETTLERQGLDSWDMCRGSIVDILDTGC